MKKLLYGFIVLLPLLFSLPAMAEEQSTSVNVEVDANLFQAQYEGGQSEGKIRTESEIKTFIQSHQDVDFMSVHRSRFPKDPAVWHKKPFLPPHKFQFKTIEEAMATIERDKENFQCSRTLFYIEGNNNPIWLLPKRPFEDELFFFRIDAPANGLDEITVEKALSFAKIFTNTRRVYVEHVDHSNPQTSGNSIGLDGKGSFLNKAAQAAGLQTQHGKSAARDYDVPYVLVYCYNDGPVSTLGFSNSPNLIASGSTTGTNAYFEQLVGMLFYNENGFTDKNSLVKISKTIGQNLNNINRVIFYAQSLKNESTEFFKDPAYEAMLDIGAIIYRYKFEVNEKILIEKMGSESTVTPINKESNVQAHKKIGALGSVIIKIRRYQ